MSAADRILGFLFPAIVAENIRLRHRVSRLDARVLQLELDGASRERHLRLVMTDLSDARDLNRRYGYTPPRLRLVDGGRSS